MRWFERLKGWRSRTFQRIHHSKKASVDVDVAPQHMLFKEEYENYFPAPELSVSDSKQVEIINSPEAVPLIGQPSKLDNKNWLKMQEEVIRLGDELDKLMPALLPDAKSIAGHIADRLTEILDRNGAEMIDSETVFDIRRHQPIPSRPVPDGTPIIKVISPGWRVEDRVLRRAKVEV